MITQSSSAWPDCKTQLCTGGDKLVNCQGSTSMGRSWAKDLQQTNSGKIKCELFIWGVVIHKVKDFWLSESDISLQSHKWEWIASVRSQPV